MPKVLYKCHFDTFLSATIQQNKCHFLKDSAFEFCHTKTFKKGTSKLKHPSELTMTATQNATLVKRFSGNGVKLRGCFPV